MIRDKDQHALIRKLSIKSFVQRFVNLIIFEKLIGTGYGLGINYPVCHLDLNESAPGEGRTPNRLIRSQVLYPLSYRCNAGIIADFRS